MDAPLDLIQDVLPGTVALAVRVRKGHRSIALLREEEAALATLRIGSSLDLTLGDPVFAVASTGQAERRGSGGLVTYLGEFEAEWGAMVDPAPRSPAGS